MPSQLARNGVPHSAASLIATSNESFNILKESVLVQYAGSLAVNEVYMCEPSEGDDVLELSRLTSVLDQSTDWTYT